MAIKPQNLLKYTHIFESGVSLPGIYPKKVVTCVHNEVPTRIIIAELWEKQAQQAALGNWLAKWWSNQTMEYYDMAKIKEVDLYVLTFLKNAEQLNQWYY